MFPRCFASLLGAALLGGPLLAQDPAAAAHAAWRDQHGAAWRLETSRAVGGFGRFLWGGKGEAAFTPETEADWFELARLALQETQPMFGVDPETLQPVAVQFLNLAEIASSDKVAVEFAQSVQGVRVVGASAHLLFTPTGELLAVDVDAALGAEGLAARPVIGRWDASAAATRWFEATEGMRVAESTEPALVILRRARTDSDLLEPRLAWAIELRNETEPTQPAGRRVYVAADASGAEVIGNDALIHFQQIQGHVDSWATPGTAAGSGSNPPAIHPMRHMRLTSGAGNATTDANGDFTFNSASPVTFTASYTGPYARVLNDAGAEYSLSQSFTPGAPATMTMNPAQTEFVTSEASCFDSVIDVRAWLKSARPSDTTVDFQVLANANLNASCNAFYNGSSINMYRAAGACNNTGYSTIVAHEEGHWMNDLYSSGNGADGFGEGNADVVGMYVYDTPIVGEDFFTNGGIVRTGWNTRQFCGDSNGGCYGEVHNDGEVLMGALWKVRDNLNQDLGNAAGDFTSDVLWANWMNAYNDSQIKTVVESHWLALDDNDGNVLNGTPNYRAIDAGFRAQGFPGVNIDTMTIVHVPLGNTQDDTGPYVVDATITSLFGIPITAAEVTYSVDGGPAQVVAMSNLGGGLWRGLIPGQPSPAIVNYHIDAHDANSNDERLPELGDWEFMIGVFTQVYFNDFEGATDEGWTHGRTSGTDDWERNLPLGASTDPNGAFSGVKAWGNDLGTGGTNGQYPGSSNNFLTSPVVDCSGSTNVRLRFARCLNVNAGPQDEARIEVNGVPFFVSPTGTAFNEGGWRKVEIDISSVADGNAAVQVTFRLKSDLLGNSGGWNVDDFQIYTLEPVPGGGNSIVLTGPTSVPAGANGQWSFSAAPASAPYWFLNGSNGSGTTFQGHPFDVGGVITPLATGTTSASGAGTVTIFIPAAASGRTGFFEVASRAGGAWFDSNLLVVTVQ